MEDDGFSSIFDAVINRPPRLDYNFFSNVIAFKYALSAEKALADLVEIFFADKDLFNMSHMLGQH